MYVILNKKNHVVDLLPAVKLRPDGEPLDSRHRAVSDAVAAQLSKGLSRPDSYPLWKLDTIKGKLVKNEDEGVPLSALRTDGKAKDTMGRLIKEAGAK